jgi:hypothetical protein
MRSGKSQPLAANVVDVSEDVGDGTAFVARDFCPPGAIIEMFQQELVHAIV